jgi:hypothetical protein
MPGTVLPAGGPASPRTGYLKPHWARGLTSLTGLIMQIRWFIVLSILALSACGENPGAQKARRATKALRDRRALLDRQAPLERPA